MSTAKVTFEFVANTADFDRKMDKLVDQNNRLLAQNKLLRQENREAARQGREQHSQFTTAIDGQITQLRSMVTQWIGVQAAISGARKLLDDYRQSQDQAAARAAGAAGGLGSLKQLAMGDQGRYNQLLRKSEDFYRAGGADSLEQAAKQVFDIISADQEANLETFKQLRVSKMVSDTGTLAAAVDTLVTSMGKEETGDLRQILSKGLKASEFAPATMEQLLIAAAKGAGSAKAVGVSDEQLLAMNTIASKGAGSAEVGGTLIGRLLGSFEEFSLMSEEQAGKQGIDLDLLHKMRTGTVAQRLRTVEAAGGLAMPQFQEIRGEIRARRGYRSLVENLDRLENMTAEIGGAQDLDLAGKSMALKEPLGDAARIAQKAKASREMVEMRRFATPTALANAIVDEFTAARVEEGAAPAWTSARRAEIGLQRWLTGDRRFLELVRSGSYEMPLSPETALGLERELVPTAEKHRERFERQRMEGLRAREGDLLPGEKALLEALERIYGTLQKQQANPAAAQAQLNVGAEK